jgi:fumarate reductase subunit C
MLSMPTTTVGAGVRYVHQFVDFSREQVALHLACVTLAAFNMHACTHRCARSGVRQASPSARVHLRLATHLLRARLTGAACSISDRCVVCSVCVCVCVIA